MWGLSKMLFEDLKKELTPSGNPFCKRENTKLISVLVHASGQTHFRKIYLPDFEMTKENKLRIMQEVRKVLLDTRRVFLKKLFHQCDE